LFPDAAANTVICLIHQACLLLDRVKASQVAKYLSEGGAGERMYATRTAANRNARKAA